MGRNRTRTMLAAAALAAGLAGGAAGFAGMGSVVAGAAEAATQVATGTTSWVGQALSGLVSDGTITQAQAEKVEQALEQARPQGGPGHHGMRGGMHDLAGVATALGMTEEEVQSGLRSGTTLAELAAEKGVDVQRVVDAVVAGMKAHLAEEVAAGEHTQAEADRMLADATARATAMVNGERPAMPPGGHEGGRHLEGDHVAPGAQTTPTTTRAATGA